MPTTQWIYKFQPDKYQESLNIETALASEYAKETTVQQQLPFLTTSTLNRESALQELMEIISGKKISPVYQPIVDLSNGEIMGYEALSRGPADSCLHRPLALFNLAVKYNLLLPLEKVCRETAIKNFLQPSDKHKLFLNLNPAVINDPNFTGGITKLFISQRGMQPSQVIFEITERTAIDDYESFHRTLQHYRRQGYSIAVDDAGAGYSSLQAIAALKPDYIKLDLSIVSNVDHDPLKQTLLESMVKLAAVIDSKIIAEGVETKEELVFLTQHGVHYAQGYLLAYPGLPLPVIPVDIKELIVATSAEAEAKATAEALPPLPHQALASSLGPVIAEIASQVPTYATTALVKEIETGFRKAGVQGMVILNEKQEPAGLLMKDKLYYHLGAKYGVSLYHNRPVKLVMDKNPLIVNADLPLETVSQMAMNRAEDNLYDLIIVVKNGHYLGAVSVMHLLNNITSLQIRCAHNSNPLTGLPGNLIIDDHLKSLISLQMPFAVIHIDLDNFKAFNDKYGFEMGDKILLLTSRILSQSIARTSQGNTFLGHIGGDDFVIIASPDNLKALGNAIIQLFDAEILSLYPPADRERGYIEVENRRGQLERFPVVSISLAAATTLQRNFTNFLEVGELLAELKKAAKKKNGSCMVIDRRS